jgi:ABC-type uncharacterized transport system substrate-binding protein
VKYGLVASFSRQGGNVTGVSFLTSQLGAKLLEIVHQLLPDAPLVGVLVNPANPYAATDTKDIQDAARVLNRNILVSNVGAERDLDATRLSPRTCGRGRAQSSCPAMPFFTIGARCSCRLRRAMGFL